MAVFWRDARRSLTEPMYPADSSPLTARLCRMPAGVVVVEMRGEVDLTTEEIMRNALADGVGTADVRLLVCDMTRVSFFGCVGLTVLLRAKAVLRQRDAQLRVVAQSHPVVMMFDLTDLSDALGLCASLEEATGDQR